MTATTMNKSCVLYRYRTTVAITEYSVILLGRVVKGKMDRKISYSNTQQFPRYHTW